VSKLVLCIDFDGTCTTHEYPRVGREIGAAPVLKRLVEAGHKLVLFTMRSGKEQNDAEKWFASHGLPLYGSNTNPTQKHWTASPKAYGQIYIDDAALGCPLIINGKDRPYVDWIKVEKQLEERGVLETNNPIDVNTFKQIFYDATLDLMNGEEAVNVEISTTDGQTRINYVVDAGRRGTMTYDKSYVIIDNGEVKCKTCELLEGCGIEEIIEEKIKEYIYGNARN